MKTEDLIDAYMEVDQDEEIYRKDVYSIYVGQDEETDPDSPTNAERWLEIRQMSPRSLELEDLNWIRRILHEKTGRGTGYGVKLYKYPDYFSGLSIWIPQAWAIQDYLSWKHWEGKPVQVITNQVAEKIKMEAVLDTVSLGMEIGLTNLIFGPLLGPLIMWLFTPEGSAEQRFSNIITEHYGDILASDGDAKWRSVIIQLEYWDYNDVAYYGEFMLNLFPFINTLDEAIQNFINVKYPVWENISFENTTPNEVIYANWDKCVRDLDKYFKISDVYGEEGYVGYTGVSDYTSSELQSYYQSLHDTFGGGPQIE